MAQPQCLERIGQYVARFVSMVSSARPSDPLPTAPSPSRNPPGQTVADLLFPWFMWIMGVSMAIAFKARKKQKQTRSQMLVQVTFSHDCLFHAHDIYFMHSYSGTVALAKDPPPRRSAILKKGMSRAA